MKNISILLSSTLLGLFITVISSASLAGILDKATSISCRNIGLAIATDLKITSIDLQTNTAHGELKVYKEDFTLKYQRTDSLQILNENGVVTIGNDDEGYGIRIFSKKKMGAGNSIFLTEDMDTDKEGHPGTCSITYIN
jgi:hypothetical protein